MIALVVSRLHARRSTRSQRSHSREHSRGQLNLIVLKKTLKLKHWNTSTSQVIILELNGYIVLLQLYILAGDIN